MEDFILLMGKYMKENITKIKKKDMGRSNGQMVNYLEGGGKMENKMAMEFYKTTKVKRCIASMKKEKEKM